MNLFSAGPRREQPKLTDHLQHLQQDLDDLGEKVRDCIAETVGRALAGFVRQGVRTFLANVGARPGVSSRSQSTHSNYDDERDPYEDVEVYPDESRPAEASMKGRGGTSWLSSWSGRDVLGLGAVVFAGLGVLRSAAVLLALADGAYAAIAVISTVIGG